MTIIRKIGNLFLGLTFLFYLFDCSRLNRVRGELQFVFLPNRCSLCLSAYAIHTHLQRD